ncbi:hypothetical protein QE435_000468 [Rhizobium sp. SORGH_AS 787]|nr:hypothetical protein [Rhizobium sp. SORGH_AS_0787]
MRTQSQWKLVEKDEVSRSGDSLLDLGISSHPCDREALDHALHRLTRIDPLTTRPDHPQVQLHHCTTRAKDILGDLMGPSSMHVKLTIKGYERGIIESYDGPPVLRADRFDNSCSWRKEPERVWHIAWSNTSSLVVLLSRHRRHLIWRPTALIVRLSMRQMLRSQILSNRTAPELVLLWDCVFDQIYFRADPVSRIH